MKSLLFFGLLLLTVFFTACESTSDGDLYSDGYPAAFGDTGGSLSGSSSGNSSGGSAADSSEVIPNESGVITAGEWNDLDHWDFWKEIISKSDFSEFPDHWNFHTDQRISVEIALNNNNPVINAKVDLVYEGNTVFSAMTDNFGKAELWANLSDQGSIVNLSKLLLNINDGSQIVTQVKQFEQGSNKITLNSNSSFQQSIEVAFVVDATGSMGDELEFLKKELTDVLQRVSIDNPNAQLRTSSVFYRDEGDEYLTRKNAFTTDVSETIRFIETQRADGGGDTPEAVHSALEVAIEGLSWTPTAGTKILFLLLDAPPHYEPSIINSIHKSLELATEKGIKIIPITASGIGKETEFLMRFLAMTSNGTYIFITDHSGIGNDHLEATVGDYEVEYLNNLMVRLINKYAGFIQ